MPITDYNKKKPLEVSSTNDSGTIQDKAQPVLISGSGTESINEESNPGSNGLTSAAPVETDEITIKQEFNGYIDEVQVVNQESGGGSLDIEVLDSNDNVLASVKSSNLTQGTLNFVEIPTSNYSRELNNEKVTIRISGTTSTALYDNSFDGDSISFSGSDHLAAYRTTGDLTVDESKTGTGDIVIDFTNISDAQDIAVYDQNGNLLDYEIESLDTAAETGVIWAYDSWVRDDTVQAQIAYGNNSANEDRSQAGTGGNAWNNTGQNAWGVMHQAAGELGFDSAQGISRTVTGVTETTGQFAGGGNYDGNDDEINFEGEQGTGDTTLVCWVKQGTNSDRDSILHVSGSNDDVFRINGLNDGTLNTNCFDITNSQSPKSDAVDDGLWHQAVAVIRATNEIEMFVDGDSVGASSTPNNPDLSGERTDRRSRIGSRDSGRFYEGDIDEARVHTDAKDENWVQADYDASPKGGQVYFSQQSAEATVTDQTVTIPETTTSSTNPDPQVNATVDVSIPKSTATTANPAPTVSPGAAPLNLTASTASTANPDFLVQPGSTTVQTPVSTSTISNPDPQVNAFNEITVPETTAATVNPAPSLTVGQTIIVPETTVSSSNPDLTVQPGESSLNISNTQISVTNPEFGLNRQIVVGVANNLSSENPEPNLQPGAVSVQVPETSILTENPALQVQPGVARLQIERPTNLETVNPDFSTVSGAAELQVSETQLTASVQEPSIGLTLEFVSPTNALITNDERFFDMPDHTFTEGDLGDTLQATLKDEVSPDGVDLTGATEIKLVVKDRDGVEVFNKEMTLADKVNGKVEYKWSQGDFIEEPGVYRAKIKVFDSTGEPESFPNDGFRTIEIEEEIS